MIRSATPLAIVLWLGIAHATEETLELATLPAPERLAGALWERSPDLADARARLGLAEADVTRSLLLLNPNLDLALGGLPVGVTTPPGLTTGQTLNVGLTLSQTVELGKRGPRQDAASAAREAALLDTRETLRQRYLDLRLRIAEVASAEVRIAALADAARDAERLTALQSARSGKGDTSGLDTERARLEQQKIESTLGEQRELLELALRECARAVGLRCAPFGDPVQAQRYLDSVAALPAEVDVGARPDLRSLAAQAASADGQATLAERHAIPDPTLRAGYLRDQFVISGNNANTLFVGVSIPLPVFDHGQADAQAARALAERARSTRALLVAQAQRDRQRLASQLALARSRQMALRERTLPLARAVVGNLEKAMLVGAPLQDLLLARRTLEELNVSSADVDLFVFQSSTELERVVGAEPPAPPRLAGAP